MDEQLSIKYNGNISPCPYREDCFTYKIGCQGESYWCKQIHKKQINKLKELEEGAEND